MATLALISLGVTLLAPQPAGAVIYLAGLAMLVGGVAGFWVLQCDVLTVAAIIGAALLLGRIVDDTVDFSGTDTSGPIVSVGVVFLLYDVAVVAAGWRFSCQHVTGVLGSIIAVGSMLAVAIIVLIFGALTIGTSGTSDGTGIGSLTSSVHGDLETALVLGLLASLAECGLYAYTRQSGYALISFVSVALLPLLVTAGLAPLHPLRWSLAYALVGGLIVAAAISPTVASNRWNSAASRSPVHPSWLKLSNHVIFTS